MRIFTALILMSFSLLGNDRSSLEIKDNDVNLKINGEKELLQKGTLLNLDEGDSVCYISGSGRVVINNQKQLNSQTKECYIIPVSKSFDFKQYMASVKNKVYVAYIDSSETLKHGTSTKGIEVNTNRNIVLNKDEGLIISSNQFGPLPVEIQLYDIQNIVIETYVNSEASTTFLHIPDNVLINVHRIAVKNGFGQILMNASIQINH